MALSPAPLATPASCPGNRRMLPPLARAALALLIGGLIYGLFRPQHLILFSWVNDLGLAAPVQAARAAFAPWRPALPDWAVYSLPAALWLYSLLEITGLVWSGQRRGRLIAFTVVGLMGLGLEFSEALLPGTGTFSMSDVAMLCLVLGLMFFVQIQKYRGVER